jgi:iron complex transport system substrate-binding protein
MKTKNKLLTAIVLCTLFLVALPGIGIAAAQEDEILDIYGNANEDNTIDMRDFTYTARIILWLEDETTLADANYDGDVNVLDMTQIGLIILGRESKLTLVDAADRIVTVNKPVERMIPLGTSPDLVVVKALGAKDKVIAVCEYTKEYEYTTFFPELSKLPSVGYHENLNYEKIFELAPDLVISPYYLTGELEETLEPEITVVCLNCGPPLTYTEEVRKLRYILNTEEDGEEYIAWYEGIRDYIEEKTSGLSDEDKPRVFDYYGGEWGMSKGPPYGTYGKKNFWVNPLIEMAGGINIAGDLPGDWITVNPEWVIRENPEVIIREIYPMISGHILGYDTDDSSEAAVLWVDIMSQPEFELSDAVKEEDVYLRYGDFIDAYWFIGLPYMAKWFHPELFSELDPQAFHQEFLTEFQRLDYDLSEHGVFVYPES